MGVEGAWGMTWFHDDRACVEPGGVASKAFGARRAFVVAGRCLITGVEITCPTFTAEGRALDTPRSEAKLGFAVQTRR